MSFLLSLILATPIFAQVPAKEVSGGFSRGNIFTAYPVQGQVQVTCSGFNGDGNATYNCRDIALEPSTYDYFVGPRDPKMKWVDILAKRSDGSLRPKTVAYNGVEGRSDEALNLWISTLFQKGLLGLGTNEIKFNIYTSDNTKEPLATGQFLATVNRGVARQCAAASYQSSDINDCSSQFSVCQRFFSERNFCR